MDRHAGRAWVNLIDNVPRWPAGTRCALPTDWDDAVNYAACTGSAELVALLRERESRLAGVRPKETEMLITNGGLHGLSLVFRSAAAAGAVALCQAPVLAAVPQMLRSMGYNVKLFRTPNGVIDLDLIRSTRPALVYLNSPNNPTGDVTPSGDWAPLLALAREMRFKLVADLVYDAYVFNERFTSPLSVTQDWSALYTVNSLSKSYGAPGLRVGWVTSSVKNIEQLTSLLERETIAISSVTQRHACRLLEHGNAPLLKAVQEGKTHIEQWLRHVEGVRATSPAGGCQVFAELAVEDVEDFCDHALEHFSLGLVSASNYEGASGSFIRIPLACEPALLTRGLEVLGTALKAYQGSYQRRAAGL